MTLLATFDHLWESKWNPIRNYQTVSGRRILRSSPHRRNLADKLADPSCFLAHLI
jgi:hypothetical protein